jgi:hypothetical protein
MHRRATRRRVTLRKGNVEAELLEPLRGLQVQRSSDMAPGCVTRVPIPHVRSKSAFTCVTASHVCKHHLLATARSSPPPAPLYPIRKRKLCATLPRVQLPTSERAHAAALALTIACMLHCLVQACGPQQKAWQQWML